MSTSLKHWLATFIILVLPISLHATECNKIIDLAKAAYFEQIDFMRRGMREDTALTEYAEFITILISKAWITNPFLSTPLGDICLQPSLIDGLTNSDGAISSASELVHDIYLGETEIAFLSQSDLDLNLIPEEKNELNLIIEQNEWNHTAEYLMEPIPTYINVSKIIFPKGSTIRIDPHQTDACVQYYKFNAVDIPTMAADELTANVVALALMLIDQNVDAEKAKRLIVHNQAYINVASRCMKEDTSTLQVPLYFLQVYARESARLSKNSTTTYNRKATQSYIMNEGEDLVRVLLSRSSDGELPTKFISTTGHVTNMTYNWDTADDVDNTIMMAHVAAPSPEKFFKYFESVANVAILATKSIYTTFDLGLERDLKKGAYEDVEDRKSFEARSLNLSRFVREKVISDARNSLGPRRIVTKERLEIPSVVRVTCGSGWYFVDRSYNDSEYEQCCASVCHAGSQGLSGAIGVDFEEYCCEACNQASCPDGDDTAAETAADVVGIDLPPSGSNGGWKTIII